MRRYADVDALMQSIRRRLGIASLDNLLESEKVIIKEINSAPTIEISDDTISRKWLYKAVEEYAAKYGTGTTMYLKNFVTTFVDKAPSIDLVQCNECKYREDCEQFVVFDASENQVIGHRTKYCSYGKRKESW